jgi:hypothetical protein
VPADSLTVEETEATSEVSVDDADAPVEAASDDSDDAASPSLVAAPDDDEPRTLL